MLKLLYVFNGRGNNKYFCVITARVSRKKKKPKPGWIGIGFVFS